MVASCNLYGKVLPAGQSQILSYVNAIHLIDMEGNIMSNLDYPQNQGEAVVNPGDRWLDEIRIPAAKLNDATAVAIGVYTEENGLLYVDSGPRDWNGRRYWISFPKSER